MRALDAEESTVLFSGLMSGLSVLLPGCEEQHQWHALLLARPPVAAAEEAERALADLWDGFVAVLATWNYTNSNTEAFVEKLMDHCAEMAGIRLLDTAEFLEDEESWHFLSLSPSSGTPTSPLRETPSSLSRSSPHTSSLETSAPQETWNAVPPIVPISALPASTVPVSTVPVSVVGVSAVLVSAAPVCTVTAASVLDASVPVSTTTACIPEANALLSVTPDDAQLTGTPASSAPPLPTPTPLANPLSFQHPPPTATTPVFRTVTFEELQQLHQVTVGSGKRRTGPRPRNEVILLANAVAREWMSGGTASVRSLAKASQWCVQSGKTACPVPEPALQNHPGNPCSRAPPSPP